MFNASSFLFIPYNKKKYFKNELAGQADVIVLDFEDSVEYRTNKDCIDEIKKALSFLNGKTLIARIGSADYFNVVASFGLDRFEGVMIPKSSNTNETIEIIQDLKNNGKKIYLLVENSKGLLDLQSILLKYKIDGIFFGSEDYTSSINATRTENNLLFARSTIINVSKAFNVPCYDTIYPFLNDEDGFRKEVKLAYEMGFYGKMAIHPSQLNEINITFKVTLEIISEYKRIIKQYVEYSKINNSMVMVLDGKLIEIPHIKRMKSIIEKFERGE
ncbi:MAG: HpcH/HpaI aldolase/citrate lyase family protein [Caldisericia bacterium]|nr:HpcH/HpaI aldolase/citrate lyase family protein [Caldisericia bacterium]